MPVRLDPLCGGGHASWAGHRRGEDSHPPGARACYEQMMADPGEHIKVVRAKIDILHVWQGGVSPMSCVSLLLVLGAME